MIVSVNFICHFHSLLTFLINQHDTNGLAVVRDMITCLGTRTATSFCIQWYTNGSEGSTDSII